MSVDRIMALGDDQQASKYEILFPNGLPGGGDSDIVSLRIDQAFDFPDVQVGSYELGHKGMKIPKTNMTDQTDKTFTFTVRIDQEWKAFDAIYDTFKMTYDPKTGTGLSDLVTRFPMFVQMLDGQNVDVKTHKYGNCKIKGFQVLGVDPVSEEPLRVTITGIYGTYEIV